MPIASSRTSASTASRYSTAATVLTSATGKECAHPQGARPQDARRWRNAARCWRRPRRGRCAAAGASAKGSQAAAKHRRRIPQRPPPRRRRPLPSAAERASARAGAATLGTRTAMRTQHRAAAPKANALDGDRGAPRRPRRGPKDDGRKAARPSAKHPQAKSKAAPRRAPKPRVAKASPRRSERMPLPKKAAGAAEDRRPRMKYRHSFHAGNFADVHKHVALCALLRAMQRKDKGFLYLDTHAGAGRYDLGEPHDAPRRRSAARRHRAAGDAAQLQSEELRDYLRGDLGASPATRLRDGSIPARPGSRHSCCARRTAACAASCCRANAARSSARSAACDACASSAPTATSN